MVLGKKVAIFEWEWVRISAPGERQKMPRVAMHYGKNFQHSAGTCFCFVLLNSISLQKVQYQHIVAALHLVVSMNE